MPKAELSQAELFSAEKRVVIREGADFSVGPDGY